ncbi:MAG: peptide deformylase [Chloroflexi bacterium]|nr:peptide deformylase [Chloroflexota bacterium]MCL5108309.1 peptide deformylase [Chloroflexota bacterium]
MAILNVLKAEHPTLRAKAKRVARVDASLERLIDDMVETMHATNGVGLAAPQVGVPLRLAVIQVPADYEEPHAGELFVLINPEIVKTTEPQDIDEGCLSLPGYAGTIQRAAKVTVKARDRNMKEYRLRAEGTLAQAVQHELDHLNGVLFYDHLAGPELLRRTQPAASQATEPTGDEPA